MTKTIFALATPLMKSGVAIIRISGTGTSSILQSLTRTLLPSPRMATLRPLYHPSDTSLMDTGIVIWFPGPHSFTGEDVAELHIHGSLALIHILYGALLTFPYTRIAEPGEFSRKAFEHGKMDLLQAEGLADLIEAETQAQAKQALRQMQGELSHVYTSWRNLLLHTMAHMEAYIDFPEEDIPSSLIQSIQGTLLSLCHDMRAHLTDNHRGERIRNGLYVTILGAPNTGKSSLLNYLAKRDVAIVSEIAGTTRDVIEVHLDIHGYPFIIADTAGLREQADAIEREGILRAKTRAQQADIKIALFDATLLPALDTHTLDFVDHTTIVVFNKADLVPPTYTYPTLNNHPALVISVKEHLFLDQLLELLATYAKKQSLLSTDPVITRVRHRRLVEETLFHLEQCQPAIYPPEITAESLRLAALSLGKIIGAIHTEDILDTLFSSFCIGK